MGAFQSAPTIEKEFEEGADQYGRKYICGSMQGWRRHQEDAHLVVKEKGSTYAIYGVFDGHGGPEVSELVARNFMRILDQTDEDWTRDIPTHVTETFRQLDLFVKTREGQDQMKAILNINEETVAPMEEDELAQLQADASKPIEKVLVETITEQTTVATSDEDGAVEVTESRVSEILRSAIGGPSPKKPKMASDQASNTSSSSSSSSTKHGAEASEEAGEKLLSSVDESGDTEDDDSDNDDSYVPKDNSQDSDDDEEDTSSTSGVLSTHSDMEVSEGSSGGDDDHGDGNDGNAMDADGDGSEQGSRDQESGRRWAHPPRNEAQQIFETMSCGYSSGTTANVLILSTSKAIVGNAGDCRTVLCRDGRALDLSVDHKPTDAMERERIEKAGSFVSQSGRIDNGLNLSRALGDWRYKSNSAVDHEDQAVSYVPDFIEQDITEEDEFLIVACDGIWNTMDSQEAVDFVRMRLAKGMPLEAIMTALLDACLAPSLFTGDGQGLDNETAIIIVLRDISGKPVKPVRPIRSFFAAGDFDDDDDDSDDNIAGVGTPEQGEVGGDNALIQPERPDASGTYRETTSL